MTWDLVCRDIRTVRCRLAMGLTRTASSSWRHFVAALRSLWTECAAIHSEVAALPTTRQFRLCSWHWLQCIHNCCSTFNNRRIREVAVTWTINMSSLQLQFVVQFVLYKYHSLKQGANLSVQFPVSNTVKRMSNYNRMYFSFIICSMLLHSYGTDNCGPESNIYPSLIIMIAWYCCTVGWMESDLLS